MARKKRNRKKKSSGGQTRTGKRYTTGEIFIAIVGAAILILMGGIVLTAIFGN